MRARGSARVGRPEVVALDIGHHFQRQLVVIAQEHRPLAVGRECPASDAGCRRSGNGLPARSPCRCAASAGSDRPCGIRRRCRNRPARLPATGWLRPAAPFPSHRRRVRPYVLDDRVRLGKVFVGRSVALAEIGNCVQAEAVDAGVEPALHDLANGADDARIVEVEIRLVREEAMPVIGLGFGVPGPVRFLGVGEDDARLRKARVGVAPDIPVARARVRRAAARAPEPGMLVGGVIDDQLGDDTQAAPLRLGDEAAEVLHRAERRIDRTVVGDVVAVVAAAATDRTAAARSR